MSDRPEIKIDNKAICFISSEGQRNLFWEELFAPVPHCRDFQREVMLQIHKLYEECVFSGVDPEVDENDS